MWFYWIGHEWKTPGHVPLQWNGTQKERENGPNKINMDVKHRDDAVSAWVEFLGKAMIVAWDRGR